MVNRSDWNVILIDDEPDNIGVIELVLDFNNIKVRTATSASDGLRLLREEVPSFLLVDIQMPVMSGYELLEEIRANEDWKDIPVIAVTAYAKPEDEERVMASGFRGYISKPINVMTLMDQITRILAK
jgi:two-component system, cell cycle response regulator DivK